LAGARGRLAALALRAPGRDGSRPPPTARAPEVRRVSRVVRQVDLWSLFRVAALLFGGLLVVVLVAEIGLLVVGSITGARAGVENFVTQLFALRHFHFRWFELLLGTIVVGVLGVAVATGAVVLAGALFNLVSDVVGGVEVTVLEERPPAEDALENKAHAAAAAVAEVPPTAVRAPAPPAEPSPSLLFDWSSDAEAELDWPGTWSSGADGEGAV